MSFESISKKFNGMVGAITDLFGREKTQKLITPSAMSIKDGRYPWLIHKGSSYLILSYNCHTGEIAGQSEAFNRSNTSIQGYIKHDGTEQQPVVYKPVES